MYSFEKPPSYKPKGHRRYAPDTRGFCAAVCRPFVSFGRYFCLKTSIHGLRHVAEPGRHWFERLVWTTAIVVATWQATSVCVGQLNRYQESPTVVTLEKDFRNWEFSLPGLTGCLMDRLDPKKAPLVIKDLWNVDPSSPKYARYLRFLNVTVNSNVLQLGNFTEFVGDPDFEDVDLLKLAHDLYLEPGPKTIWSPHTNPSFKWYKVMTEYGICVSTNSLAILDIAVEKVDTNITNNYPIKCQFSAQICSILITTSYTAQYFIHSPYDTMDVTMKPHTGSLTKQQILELNVVETGSGKGVRDLSRTRRGCYYTDEPDIEGRKIYSTTSCRLHCRSQLSVKLCGCRPYYYSYEGGPICNTSGMACLVDHNQQLANIADCNCHTQCIFSIYEIVNVDDDELSTSGAPFTAVCSMKFQLLPPRTRFTREILFSFQDLIVSFGGAAGLFLGASFISLVELVYFILVKLVSCATSTVDKEEHPLVKTPKITFEEMRIQELTAMLDDTYCYGGHGILIEN